MRRARAIAFIQKHPKKLLLSIILLIAYYFCLPEPLFNTPISTVIESREGKLLGAKIADDGQWRFPLSDSIPSKFRTCLLQFEDAHFYKHPGFNPVSMFKAISANISAGKVVRGGSTLTQQVIRLSRKKKRSYWEKFVELILATRLEFRYSKEEILRLYAGNAPYGGNVVGLEMAAWRYFGLQPNQLSWAESATLAVLPNAPSLIYPGKNQSRLLEKRDKLLQKLLIEKRIDSTTYTLALLEKLPQKPYALPKSAKHLVASISRERKGERLRTTIDETLQKNVNTIVAKHYNDLKQNQVHNAAVLVMDVKTREVLVYVGNTPTTKNHEKDVDMIRANRSTGSTLKPFLYAAMIDAGELIPNMLVADVPTQIAGYTPENFDESYSGAVPARRALSRSLNIPAVRLLQSYGLEKFRDQLNFFELGGITKSADHYGLTLILGGAESNLWDLSKAYAGMAGTVNHFNDTSSEYYEKEFCEPVLLKEHQVTFGKKRPQKTIFDAGSFYLTFEAMKEVNRPEGNESWEFYDSSKEIAWKTGTSFGNKDAWALGLTRDYVVGVWVGNADGEGRPDLTGVRSAAPLLFDVFDILPPSDWFQKPLDEFVEIVVCAESGYLKSPNCPGQNIQVPRKENKIKACNYHRSVQLDLQRRFRVNSSCADLSETISASWFVLPPLMEFYYKKNSPSYVPLPPLRRDCLGPATPSMDFIYPKNGSRISLTKNFEGEKNELVLKLAHTKPGTKVFWYLDERFITQTQNFHETGILPDQGKHKITALDELGNEKVITITIE
ncbi:MAG: penicillin-binding protein 1C [Flavobacteriaceae bacterium]